MLQLAGREYFKLVSTKMYWLKYTDLELNKIMQIFPFSIHIFEPNLQIHA